eukprot:jgi/Botrbrau1/23390/Bobra.0051s0037.1
MCTATHLENAQCQLCVSKCAIAAFCVPFHLLPQNGINRLCDSDMSSGFPWCSGLANLFESLLATSCCQLQGSRLRCSRVTHDHLLDTSGRPGAAQTG